MLGPDPRAGNRVVKKTELKALPSLEYSID